MWEVVSIQVGISDAMQVGTIVPDKSGADDLPSFFLTHHLGISHAVLQFASCLAAIFVRLVGGGRLLLRGHCRARKIYSIASILYAYSVKRQSLSTTTFYIPPFPSEPFLFFSFLFFWGGKLRH